MTLQWHDDDLGRLTGIHWKDWLDRRDKYIDPYLVWADIAGSESYAAPEQDGGEASQKWPFIIELAHNSPTVEYRDSSCHDDVDWIFCILDIPGVYKRQGSDADSTDLLKIDGQYITARLYARDVEHLMASGMVKRAQLGLPRLPIERTPPPEVVDGLQATDANRRIVIGIIDDGFGFAHHRLLDASGAPRVRYLWDQDIRRKPDFPVSHWETAALLGYGAELGPEALEHLIRFSRCDSLAPYRDAQYGRYWLGPLAHSSAPIDADGCPLPTATLVASTHGHAVMDLAAGYPSRHRGQDRPLQQLQSTKPRPPDAAAESVRSAVIKAHSTPSEGTEDVVNRIARLHHDPVASIDSADQWPLVCVQLPGRTVNDTSGGSLAVHVLDGLRYVVDRARRIPYFGPTNGGLEGEPKFTANKVVVNVSYGAFGGGHDGSSILERAVDSLVRNSPRLWVVLAAGNAHGSSTHTSLEMVPGDRRTFTWEVPADNPLESYLEIWLPDRDTQGCTIPHGVAQQICISLQPPGGPPSPLAYNGSCWQMRRVSVGRDGNEQHSTVAAVVRPAQVAQSMHGTMILVAVAPTRAFDPLIGIRSPAPCGDWSVCLHWGEAAAPAPGPKLQIHVWTERNDLVFNNTRRQQSHVFSDEPVAPPNEADPEARAAWERVKRSKGQLRTENAMRPQLTLSSLASGQPARAQFARPDDRESGAVAVVGSHRISDGEAGAASSGGPSRLTSHEEEWDHLTAGIATPQADLPRAAPDVDAPGDLSPSVPGLRTAGFHSAVETRISATSAAAALVTRAIANVQYMSQLSTDLLPSNRRKWADDAERLLFEARLARPEEDPARPTLTPRGDDTFRRGRHRLR